MTNEKPDLETEVDLLLENQELREEKDAQGKELGRRDEEIDNLRNQQIQDVLERKNLESKLSLVAGGGFVLSRWKIYAGLASLAVVTLSGIYSMTRYPETSLPPSHAVLTRKLERTEEKLEEAEENHLNEVRKRWAAERKYEKIKDGTIGKAYEGLKEKLKVTEAELKKARTKPKPLIEYSLGDENGLEFKKAYFLANSFWYKICETKGKPVTFDKVLIEAWYNPNSRRFPFKDPDLEIAYLPINVHVDAHECSMERIDFSQEKLAFLGGYAQGSPEKLVLRLQFFTEDTEFESKGLRDDRYAVIRFDGRGEQ